MLFWLVALGFAILLLLLWPGSKRYGTEGHADTLLPGLGIPKVQTGSSLARGAGDGASRTVELVCKPSALANYLLKHCRTFSCYAPCVGWTWRASALLQSVHEGCWPCQSPVQFVRDHLQLSDDGLVALDWAVPPHQKRRRTSSHSTVPVLLVIPNSFGKITRNVLKVNYGSRQLPVAESPRTRCSMRALCSSCESLTLLELLTSNQVSVQPHVSLQTYEGPADASTTLSLGLFVCRLKDLVDSAGTK